MVLLWICLPIAIAVIAWSIGIVVLPSRREARLRRTQAVIEGKEPPKRSDAIHLAVDVGPAVEHAPDRLRHHAASDAGLPASEIIVERTPDDRQVLLSVPTDASGDAVDRLFSEIEQDGAFGEVRDVSADGSADSNSLGEKGHDPEL